MRALEIALVGAGEDGVGRNEDAGGCGSWDCASGLDFAFIGLANGLEWDCEDITRTSLCFPFFF